jgi:hypothetical protein
MMPPTHLPYGGGQVGDVERNGTSAALPANQIGPLGTFGTVFSLGYSHIHSGRFSVQDANSQCLTHSSSPILVSNNLFPFHQSSRSSRRSTSASFTKTGGHLDLAHLVRHGSAKDSPFSTLVGHSLSGCFAKDLHYYQRQMASGWRQRRVNDRPMALPLPLIACWHILFTSPAPSGPKEENMDGEEAASGD